MSYEEAYLEGYYDALDELNEDPSEFVDEFDYSDDDMFDDDEYEAYEEATDVKLNPLPYFGGGDLKGDIMSTLNIGNSPMRAAAVKSYLDKGNTFKGGIIGGIYGTENGIPYRKNRFLPGSGSSSPLDDSTVYDSMYLHLKPKDREMIMKEYLKKHKK